MTQPNRTSRKRELPPCVASVIGEQVDVRLNGGAIREARNATDVMVQVDEGVIADDDESEYIEGEKRFVPQKVDCALCLGTVALSADGSVTSEDCVVSGSCEKIWVSAHPDQFIGKDGEPTVRQLPCSGYRCSVVLELAMSEGTLTAEVVDGKCTVDVEDERYQTEGRAALNRMTPTRPEEGLETYDGMN